MLTIHQFCNEQYASEAVERFGVLLLTVNLVGCV